MSDSRQYPPTGEITATFGRIGAPMEEQIVRMGLSPEDAATVAALPPGSALLIVQRGTEAGERFLLDSDRVAAGRSPKAEIFLDDVTVSRRHVEFVRDGLKFSVRDVGSLNGTYVNRQRVDAAQLNSGDEVQIGKFRMSFHASPNQGFAG